MQEMEGNYRAEREAWHIEAFLTVNEMSARYNNLKRIL